MIALPPRVSGVPFDLETAAWPGHRLGPADAPLLEKRDETAAVIDRFLA